MAAPARPYWTGFLKLSLVTIGVRLYTATTERDKVRFHMIHEPSGERVRQQLVVPGIGPVEREDIVKGYEYEKGRYINVDPDDIKRLRLETTDTIDITEFVEDIDPIYFDTPYYLVPDGSVAEEGYRVIREALRESGRVAVGRVVINGQERIISLRPLGTGLLGNALRYPDEIRRPEDYFGSIAADAVDEDQLAIMQQIIARRSRDFEPSQFVDRYQAALRELIEEKLQGRLPPKEPERRPAQVINLMDALKRSLAAEEGTRADAEDAPARRRAAARRAEAEEAEEVQESAAPAPAKAASRGRKSAPPPANQRNLLLPVSGGRGSGRGKAAEAAPPEPAEAPAAKRRKRA
ncbi:MAG: Ku protein [Alphaproteobacteria bacterium]